MTEPFSSIAARLADLPMEDLAFTLVPVTPRHDGWTPDRQRGFIRWLAVGASVAVAAVAVGKSRQGAYALRERPGAESFAAAWDAALALPPMAPEEPTAWQRAVKGVLVPVTYRGRTVAHRRQFSDRTLTNILRGIYAARERAEARGDVSAEGSECLILE